MPRTVLVWVAMVFCLLATSRLYASEALLKAAFEGDVQRVQSLLAGGADVNFQRNGASPLLLAAARGHTAVARVLINSGAAINARNPSGFTPLMIAVKNRYAQLARLLIDNGADARGAAELPEAQNPALAGLFKPKTQAPLAPPPQPPPATTQALPSAPTTAPTPEEQRRQTIQDLLALAERQYRNLQLTTPAGNNAYETYRDVLALDSNNAQAKAGLEKIVQRYARMADTAAANGRLADALAYLDKALAVAPQHPQLLATQRALRERQAPPEPDRGEEIERLLARAQTLRTQGELEQSLALVAEGLQIVPEHEPLLALQGELSQAIEQRQAELARQEHITALLRQAERQLDENKLLAPPEDNAYASYQVVLELAADQPQARAGLTNVFAAVERLAQQYRAQRQLDTSLELIRQGLAVRSDWPTLSALANDIQQQQQAELARQQREREQQQLALQLRQQQETAQRRQQISDLLKQTERQWQEFNQRTQALRAADQALRQSAQQALENYRH